MYKYLKYKNKYIKLKNQLGSANFFDYADYEDNYYHLIEPNINCKEKIIKDCSNQFAFINRLGSCWFLAVLTIFIFSDSISNCVQNKLSYLKSKEIINNIIDSSELINIILDYNYNKNLLVDLLYEIQKKFIIKVSDTNIKDSNIGNVQRQLQRQLSFETEKNINKIYFELLYKKNITNYGGLIEDIFFIVNILSSILLDKLIKLNIYNINQEIIMAQIQNSIGIIIQIDYHSCCFYECNNIKFYCSHNIIIEYEWDKLFIEYNKLINSKKEFNILCIQCKPL